MADSRSTGASSKPHGHSAEFHFADKRHKLLGNNLLQELNNLFSSFCRHVEEVEPMVDTAGKRFSIASNLGLSTDRIDH